MEIVLLIFYWMTMLFVALAVLFSVFIKKNIFSQSVVFPMIYVVYSFLAPLGIIYMDEGYFLHPLHYEYIQMDASGILVTHAALLAFLLFWYVGYFISNPTIQPVVKVDVNVSDAVTRSASFAAAFCCVFLSGLYIKDMGAAVLSHMSSGVSVYYSMAHNDSYSTTSRAIYPLWGASIMLLFALHFSSVSKSVTVRLLAYSNLSLYVFFSVVQGDRGQLLVVLLTLGCLYSYLVKPLGLKVKHLAIVFLSLVFMTYIRVLRGYSVGELISRPELLLEVGLIDVANTVISSGESIAPYLSVYYSAVENSVMLFGETLLWLVVSFIPRAIFPWRPDSFSYSFYSAQAGLPEDRGFTLHFVADWILNFGLVGIFFGFFLGGASGYLERRAIYSGKLLWVYMMAAYTGFVPQLLRGGIESIKALVYEYLLIGIVVFYIAPIVHRFVQRASRGGGQVHVNDVNGDESLGRDS